MAPTVTVTTAMLLHRITCHGLWSTRYHSSVVYPSMASTLAWLDYSERDRKRALEVIDLFRETGTVDELGLAGVRNSFSDLFFPGTSTIQTRACYFLHVPWTLLRLERLRVPSSEAASRGRQEERILNGRLLAGEDTTGVFGSQAGDALKRLPSEVYWGGLRSWGIRTFPGHISAYFRSLDEFYRRLTLYGSSPQDPEGRNAPPANWHPHLPEPPPGFPRDKITVALRREDAEYLRNRIRARHPDSLLAVLVGRSEAADLTHERPWDFADLAELSPVLRERLHEAKLFAVCMHGAALLYNLMLAELQCHEQRIETYSDELETWGGDVAALESDLAGWRLDEVWRVVRSMGRTPGNPMQIFVENWVETLKRRGPEAVVRNDSEARILVRDRESRLKGNRARLVSPRHLELWGGQSGTGRMDYRWGVTGGILRDIIDGLARSEVDAGNA